jgi:hypothetical protein
MHKKKSHPIADRFSNDEIDQIKRYGQALHGGVTPFDKEVEKHLTRYEANRKKMKAKAQAAQGFQNAPPPPTGALR